MTRTTELVILIILSCVGLWGQDASEARECTSLGDVDCYTSSGGWQFQDSDGCNVCTQSKDSPSFSTCTLLACPSPVPFPLTPGPHAHTAETPEPPLCDTAEIRYKVEWASPADEYLEFGVMWRGLHAIHWSRRAAVGLAKHLIAQGRQNVRSVRVWEEREVQLDCESTREDIGSDTRKPNHR